LPIQPLYPRARDAVAIPAAHEGAWESLARVDQPDAAGAHAQALTDLENGSHGLQLVLEGATGAYGFGLAPDRDTLDHALESVILETALPIVLDAGPSGTRAAAHLDASLAARQVAPADVRILFGLDAYNGSILWNWSAPEVRRANVTRDCSNMAASGDTFYLVHNKFCMAIDGQSGSRARRFEVPRSGANGPRDWSYVAAGRDLLIGSRVKPEGSYLGDDGEWYEEYAPDQVSRVTSDLLFALDPATGKSLWEYKGGAVLNSTITIGDGMIFFIESRNPAAVRRTRVRCCPAK
jgi:hypothetical protein